MLFTSDYFTVYNEIMCSKPDVAGDIEINSRFLPFSTSAQYWSNPQYFVQMTDTDNEDNTKSTLVVSLMQKYRRQMKTDLLNTAGLEEAIGFDILRVL